MKKVFGLILIALLAVTLSACNGTKVPEDILDCVQNPSDPDCEIPAEVDCVLHPEDPDCDVEPLVCETGTHEANGVCVDDELVCDVGQHEESGACVDDTLSCPVGQHEESGTCVVDPLVCPTGQEEVDGACVLIDARSTEEMLADTIISLWSGNMDHVNSIMDQINNSDSYELTTTYNLEMLDDESEAHQATILIVDKYLQGEDMIIHRMVTVDVDDEHMEYEIVFEEEGMGVNIYYNVDFLLTQVLSDANDPDGDIAAVLATLDANEEWYMFSFDDSLQNMIELEVLEGLLATAFFDEFGLDVFVELQADLETELDMDLSLYNFDLDMLMEYMIDKDWDNAQMAFDAIDFESFVHDVDMQHLTPEVINFLEDFDLEIEALDVNDIIDLNAEYLYLADMGTEAWLNQLSDEEIAIYIEVFTEEPELRELFELHSAGTLDHYLVMELLNDVDVQAALDEIPGFDVTAFVAAFDNLDYDAYYLETKAPFDVLVEVYNGQTAFDAFLVQLALTAPESASILAPFSGTVDYLSQYKVFVDDGIYAIEELTTFSPYFGLDYYMDNDMLDYAVEKTETFSILTTVTLDAGEAGTLFADVLGDMWMYLDGFETFEIPNVANIHCENPATDECEPFDEYQQILQALNLLGDLEITYLYDPSNPTQMTTVMDMTDMANTMMLVTETTGFVTDASMTRVQKDIPAFSAPAAADVTDLNAVAEDFAKFALTMKAYEYLEEVFEYYTYNNFPTGDQSILLVDLDVNLSGAFDPEASYVHIDLPSIIPTMYVDPSTLATFEIELVWLDGTSVFVNNPGWEELYQVYGSDNGAPLRDDYLLMVNLVDEENFSLMKLALAYLWEEEQDNYKQPMPPGGEDDFLPIYNSVMLMLNDGTNTELGQGMMIAYDGYVYDVSTSPEWSTGSHHGMMAGTDITDALNASGHGASVIEGLTKVAIYDAYFGLYPA